METFVKGRNFSNDEKRIKLSETLNKALYLESIGKKLKLKNYFLNLVGYQKIYIGRLFLIKIA